MTISEFIVQAYFNVQKFEVGEEGRKVRQMQNISSSWKMSISVLENIRQITWNVSWNTVSTYPLEFIWSTSSLTIQLVPKSDGSEPRGLDLYSNPSNLFFFLPVIAVIRTGKHYRNKIKIQKAKSWHTIYWENNEE